MRFFKSTLAALVAANLLVAPTALNAQELGPCVLDVEADFDSVEVAEIDREGLHVVQDIGIELVRLTPGEKGGSTKAYLKLINFGELDDHFICAATPHATAVRLSNDINGPIALNAESELDFATDTSHFALEGLIDPLAPGQTIELLFQFDFGGLFKARLPVSE